MTLSLGSGPLWSGNPHPSAKAEHPDTLRAGMPIGEYLRVESVARVSEGRLFYLVNNVGPKWSRRKCWSCGNKYSPALSKCCSFCLTPLRDIRLLMSERWDPSRYEAFEQFAALRLQHFGLVTPLAVYRRTEHQIAVYHYNGEHLLSDEPTPMAADRFVMVGRFLARVLEHLHSNGVVLGGLSTRNVLVMPDDSVRLFDPDVLACVGDEIAVRRHPTMPVARDTIALCAMMAPFVAPEDLQVRALVDRGLAGKIGSPKALGDAFEDLAARSGPRPRTMACALSDVGLIRAINEDSWTWKRLADPMVLYAVADGMGGHASGEVASALACKVIGEVMGALPTDASPDKIEAGLRDGFTAANTEIRAGGKKRGEQSGTTLVAAVVSGRRQAVVAHCGDSRAYALSDGKLKLLTRDHSLGRELVEQGKLTWDQVRTAKNAHVLTSSLGGEDEDLEVDVARIDGRRGDRLLLCSDGLWSAMGEDRITARLSERERGPAVHGIVKDALDAGTTDNVTAIVVDFA